MHREDVMALPETLATLAATASGDLVSAATSDRWPAVRDGFARLFGHADPRQVGMIEGRLESTREDLQTATDADAARLRADFEAAWRARITRLLETHPAQAQNLRTLLTHLHRAAATP